MDWSVALSVLIIGGFSVYYLGWWDGVDAERKRLHEIQKRNKDRPVA